MSWSGRTGAAGLPRGLVSGSLPGPFASRVVRARSGDDGLPQHPRELSVQDTLLSDPPYHAGVRHREPLAGRVVERPVSAVVSGPPDRDPGVLPFPFLPEDPLRPASARAHVEDDEMARARSADVHVTLRLFESLLDRSR